MNEYQQALLRIIELEDKNAELLGALEQIVDAHLHPINLWSTKKLNLALPNATEAISKNKGD